MAIVTKTIAEVPAIDALASDDEMLVRDTSKGESARVTMQEIADFVGGGGGDASTWSQYPATQDVDMDGHDVVGLPTYPVANPPADPSVAASFATAANMMAYALAAWATAPASQDVDMDGHKITGLDAPTDAADAATKGYVDARLPELEWWDPVWTPLSNVDSVSNVECQYTRVYRAAGGSLVTLEGTIEVTPNSAGPCIVQANLPIAMVGSVLLAGTAMAMESSGNVVAAAMVQNVTLTLGFTAEGTDPYLVGFRASYRAA